ncbi:MAG: GroES family chaperonin [Candidatus Woesearchaeota archaeon]
MREKFINLNTITEIITRGDKHSMTKIKPLQDNVLLKKVEVESSTQEVVSGGIIIPKEEKSITYGEVIDFSEKIPNISIKKGDKVIYPEYGGRKITIDEEEFILLPYKDISAIIEL